MKECRWSSSMTMSSCLVAFVVTRWRLFVPSLFSSVQRHPAGVSLPTFIASRLSSPFPHPQLCRCAVASLNCSTSNILTWGGWLYFRIFTLATRHDGLGRKEISKYSLRYLSALEHDSSHYSAGYITGNLIYINPSGSLPHESMRRCR